METYRLFIAAELAPEAKAELTAAQDRLRRGDPPIRWVAPEAMHLTLKFLGETDVALLPALAAAMRSALSDEPPFSLRLAAAGAFPNLRRPSVVWAGVGGAVAALGRIQASLDAALATIGIARDERPFSPHLTLGRVRREASAEQQERIGAAVRALPPLRPIGWTVDDIVLFRSELSGAGPTYTQLESVQF
ncbi:MAG: RNA 2',3'-cyclic phosphodiesterase [Kouleothrix sp.]|nr:RNA 2',3'-cyclic phosphodiesterase [Kouleothrix sp.]